MSNKFKSVDDAFNFMVSFVNFERSKKQTIRDYRLDRMNKLLDHFGNPDKYFKTIHLAGSKGKGSTAMFLASALNAAGEKTGLYSSPHISDFRERISLGGLFFEDYLYIETASEIAEGLKTFILDDETGSSEPTTFELLTLMAFLIFKKSFCTWAVIETGIGGRLDSTNVITPETGVITHIEMEHTDILGDTIEKIASEKAGIIKQGVPVFSGKQSDTVMGILQDKSKAMNSSLIFPIDSMNSINTTISEHGTQVTFTDKNDENITFNLSTIGNVQVENALLAWTVLNKILQPDTKTKSFLIKGINKAKLPGRFEIINKNNFTFVFDGAHTPVSVNRLLETWNSMFDIKGILIFGSVADKNPSEMAKLLSPHFNKIIISTPGTFKESYPEDVFDIFSKHHKNVKLIKNPEDAYSYSMELSNKKLPILIAGSFYMVSEIRKLIVD
ncbi:MAG: bifunctional folylpolyglutamate synthase/dihydrofolate synthase [Spirochaetales bacterium]|nr:bifunctional folylpolyglutamate synthase/dihydrofolate synthase [Spirochaetales bacterium]